MAMLVVMALAMTTVACGEASERVSSTASDANEVCAEVLAILDRGIFDAQADLAEATRAAADAAEVRDRALAERDFDAWRQASQEYDFAVEKIGEAVRALGDDRGAIYNETVWDAFASANLGWNAARLGAFGPSAGLAGPLYDVRVGDTLDSIAEAHGVHVGRLLFANTPKQSYPQTTVTPGESLVIPYCDVSCEGEPVMCRAAIARRDEAQ